MASVNIQSIKNLKERTGAGMMDCKKALENCDGDEEKAIDWLRENGIAKAAKKSARIAAEGLTYVTTCDKCGKGIIVEINCETDFVSRADAFIDLVHECAKTVMHEESGCINCAKEATASLFTDATVKLGEKIDFRRFDLVKLEQGQCFGSYIHLGGKISVLLVLDKEDKELADGLAMHIAANNPSFVSMDSIPAEVVSKEKEIQLETMKNDEKLKNKPAQALEKICEGKVHKALAEQVLCEQAYLLSEDGATVGTVLKNKGCNVVKFIRYQVGEGIEKRQDNFAEEVMAQAK